MLRHWRIWMLLIFIIGATLAIGFKSYPYGRNGVEVVYVSMNSSASDFLNQGDIITNVNGMDIKNLDDWTSAASSLSGEVSMTANGKMHLFNLTGPLGVDALDIERTNLDMGLDLRGGSRVILRPKTNATREMVDEVIATLQTRANIYGLKEIKFFPISTADRKNYIQIEAAGIGGKIIDDLLSRQGNFEAKVSKPVKITDNTVITLGPDEYPVNVGNETLEINNTLVKQNETFTLAGINFRYVNRSMEEILLLADVYEGSDIELVYTDTQRAGVIPEGDAFRFYFTVLVSSEGAERFGKVTSGIPSRLDLQSGDSYLKDSSIYLYLDGQLVSSLRIATSLGGVAYPTPQVTGYSGSMEEAVAEKLRLQTILRSGAIPVSLETVSVDIISPRLGSDFIQSAGYSAILAGLVVFVVLIIRYRKLGVALPLVFISLTEVLIILGIAATRDSYIWGGILLAALTLAAVSWVKKHEIDITFLLGAMLIPLLGFMSWTIDLPAIGGIIAAIGTGVDHQIIIADEALGGKEKRIYTMKEKIKRAFFIIFGAAATTIAAMVPLMGIGIGMVRGFAITIVVGVLVGVLITRPAYAAIVEATTKE